MITDAGFLKAPANLTRIGVFEYKTVEGGVIRELRLPEEVFSEDSLESFELVPVTDNHPAKPVDSKSAKLLQAGSVSKVKQEGDYVAATLMVTDAGLIEKITSGKQELSCGYSCELEPAGPGAVWTDAAGVQHPYDFIQRNIRGNHVAVVAKGRAGPQVRIQLDSHESVLVTDEEDKEIRKMSKLKLDASEFEVAEEVAVAVEAELAKFKLAAEQATAKADAANSRADTAEAELAKATSKEVIEKAVQARIAVENIAKKYSVKSDGLSEQEVKKAVIAKLNPKISLEDKSEEYVNAFFDAVSATAPNPLTLAGESVKVAQPERASDTLESAFSKALFGKGKK